MLNYCGVRPDLIEYVADRSEHKQGLYMPAADPGAPAGAARRDEARLRPDPRLEPEGRDHEQLAHLRESGTRFVTPVPHVEVHA